MMRAIEHKEDPRNNDSDRKISDEYGVPRTSLQECVNDLLLCAEPLTPHLRHFQRHKAGDPVFAKRGRPAFVSESALSLRNAQMTRICKENGGAVIERLKLDKQGQHDQLQLTAETLAIKILYLESMNPSTSVSVNRLGNDEYDRQLLRCAVPWFGSHHRTNAPIYQLHCAKLFPHASCWHHPEVCGHAASRIYRACFAC